MLSTGNGRKLMAVHPKAADILELVHKAGRPEYWELPPQVARANHEKAFPVLDLDPIEVGQVVDAVADGFGPDVPVRIYSPRASAFATRHDASPGALLWLHGGGHVVGSIACYDALCRHFCALSEQVIVSVEYRLAPEHKFPAAVEDTATALSWLVRTAAEWGIEAGRIAIGGDSAGANLAAVGALWFRDTKAIALRHQLLVYPVTAPWPDSDSQRRYAEGHLLTRRNIDWFQTQYLRSEADREDWRFAPLLQDNLRGLPAATVILAECDPLHDEGLAYANRLSDAGNPVEIIDYPGMLHGFLNMGGWLAQSRDAVDRCGQILKRVLSASSDHR